MKKNDRKIEGYIVWIECQHCNEKFPAFTFSGDIDQVTEGLGALSCMTDPEIIISELTASEWNSMPPEVGIKKFVQRVSNLLDRDDLILPVIASYEHSETDDANFQEFLKKYKPSMPVYKCIKCGRESGRVIRTISPSDFKAEGGAIQLVGKLSLKT
ncbi:MAG TPA: hypothetical protein DCO77_04085 [Nitrospiraceae bacterium]|nr:hypothetical protein [Nitrospiraceae bacterium]